MTTSPPSPATMFTRPEKLFRRSELPASTAIVRLTRSVSWKAASRPGVQATSVRAAKAANSFVMKTFDEVPRFQVLGSRFEVQRSGVDGHADDGVHSHGV